MSSENVLPFDSRLTYFLTQASTQELECLKPYEQKLLFARQSQLTRYALEDLKTFNGEHYRLAEFEIAFLGILSQSEEIDFLLIWFQLMCLKGAIQQEIQIEGEKIFFNEMQY